MTTTASSPSTTVFEPRGDREIVMARTFSAPRELVWRASTEAGHFAQWWGPRGYTCQVREWDVRPGGRWEVMQTAPDGSSYRFWGEYLEISAPERLVLTQRFGEYPPMVVTIILEEREGGTALSSVMRFDSPESRAGAVQSGMEWGGRQSWDRLAELLETM